MNSDLPDPSTAQETRVDPMMTFQKFSEVNRRRCESAQGFNHQLGSWSTSDWMTAVIGEVGEAANVIKKLNRYRDGVPGNKQSEATLRANLRSELGDVFVYLDLLCQSLGFNIADAAVDVFDAKSLDIGYPETFADTGDRITAPAPADAKREDYIKRLRESTERLIERVRQSERLTAEDYAFTINAAPPSRSAAPQVEQEKEAPMNMAGAIQSGIWACEDLAERLNRFHDAVSGTSARNYRAAAKYLRDTLKLYIAGLPAAGRESIAGDQATHPAPESTDTTSRSHSDAPGAPQEPETKA